MAATVIDDAENERAYEVPAPQEGNQRGVRVSVGRDGRGRYWQFRLDNVNGADFSLDGIQVDFLVLGRRP